MKKALLYLLIFCTTVNLVAQNNSPLYSFFVAGHTYGSPLNPHYGLHFPFVNYIPEINNYSTMKFGVLTGDVVVSSTPDYWDSAIIDINKLNIPVYIAAGNHDIGPAFINIFEHYYFSFKFNNDLFIILTPGLDAWNISGDQLEFLTNTLDSNYYSVNNIFIFLHELIWWSPENIYQNVKINYAPYYPGSTNFDSVVKPLLLSYPNKITLYAGDLGCAIDVSPCMYHSFDNITLIGSGMGGGVKDNIIITNVYDDSVYYDLVAINGDDPNAMGEITDYSVINSTGNFNNHKIRVYPNPCKDFFILNNQYHSNMELKIFNRFGRLVQTDFIEPYSKIRINITGLKSGIYLLTFAGYDIFYKQKIVILE